MRLCLCLLFVFCDILFVVWLVAWLVGLQELFFAGWQFFRLAGLLNRWQGWLTVVVGWLVAWLISWWAGWLVGWFVYLVRNFLVVGWLVGWLVSWLAC